MSQHKFNNTKVRNLEGSDFTGKSLTISKKKFPGVVLVFIWSSYCGFCLNAVPALAQVAEKHNNKTTVNSNSITITAVQADSDKQNDKAAVDILSSISLINGVPQFFVFKNGEFKGVYNGDRSPAAIESYLMKV